MLSFDSPSKLHINTLWKRQKEFDLDFSSEKASITLLPDYLRGDYQKRDRVPKLIWNCLAGDADRISILITFL